MIEHYYLRLNYHVYFNITRLTIHPPTMSSSPLDDSTIRDAQAAARSATLAASLTSHTHSLLTSGVSNLVTSLDAILESRSKIRDRTLADGVRFLFFRIWYLILTFSYLACLQCIFIYLWDGYYLSIECIE